MENNALHNQILRLPNGRTLGYAETGSRGGLPLMILHGSPGSRLDGLYTDAFDLGDLNIHVAALDRPGMGLSDFQPRRTFMDLTKDVCALADHLGWMRFALMGVSGGGPYAAACALALPDRLTRVGLVSSVAPMDAPGVTKGMGPGKMMFKLARWAPWLPNLMMNSMAKGLQTNPQQVLNQAGGSFSVPDQELFKRPEVGQAFVASLREAFRNGTKGVVYDMGMYASAWGFRLAEINAPVFLWHGEKDKNAPVAMGRYLANAIPKCQPHFFPGEGHLTVFANQVREIFRTLLPEA